MKCNLIQLYLFLVVVMHRVWMDARYSIRRSIPTIFRYHFVRYISYYAPLLVASILQGCCDLGEGSSGKTTYQYQLQLVDSTNLFKRVSFNNSSIVQQSATNVIEWKIFLKPPQTVMYIETKKGFDTIVYEVRQSEAEYGFNECREWVEMTIDNPKIIYHTFDTVYYENVNSVHTSYFSNDIIVTVAAKLK